MKKYWMLLGVVLMAVAARGDVRLAVWFTDNGVLQRGKEVPVWGWADAGEKVVVSFMGKRAEAVAGKDGKWLVRLPEMGVVKEGQEMVVKGKNEVVLKNVLVGDVWICGGQSNMEWMVRNSENAEAEIAAAKWPLVRHIKVEHVVSEKPEAEVELKWKGWAVCSPEVTGNFTAVGYFFGREIFKETGVPVGLIADSWGGTKVEAWIPASAFAKNPEVGKPVFEAWQEVLERYPALKERHERFMAAWKNEKAEAAKKGEKFTKRAPTEPVGPGSRHSPSGLFNGMIAPLVPYAVKGAIWYQGESNAAVHERYLGMFKLLIGSWREAFGQGDFPFYWVQLASYKGATGSEKTMWGYLREAQDGALVLPNTGQAVAVDIGEETNIHPKNKQEAGRRLALIALARDYGKKVVFEGPRFAKWEAKGKVARVEFLNAKGLMAKGGEAAGFEVAGKDEVFYPAKARVVGEAVEVSAEEVPVVVAVRYAFRNFPKPEVNMYNGAGLPMVPFRTDKWAE